MDAQRDVGNVYDASFVRRFDHLYSSPAWEAPGAQLSGLRSIEDAMLPVVPEDPSASEYGGTVLLDAGSILENLMGKSEQQTADEFLWKLMQTEAVDKSHRWQGTSLHKIGKSKSADKCRHIARFRRRQKGTDAYRRVKMKQTVSDDSSVAATALIGAQGM